MKVSEDLAKSCAYKKQILGENSQIHIYVFNF